MAEAGSGTNLELQGSLRGLLEKLSIGSQKDTRRERLIAVSAKNIDIVNQLISEIRRLSDNGQEKDANKLADITEQLLDNNANLQTVVGEVLSDLK
jgi:nucleosome binding factor SPN SPT16 subunit